MTEIYRLLLVLWLLNSIIIPSIGDNGNGQQIPQKGLIGLHAAEESLSAFINLHSSDVLLALTEHDRKEISLHSFTSINTVQYPAKIQYEFSTNYSKFDVNALSGQVEGFLSYEYIVGNNVYTLYDGESIAINYASQLYPNFSYKPFKLCEKSSMSSFKSSILMYSWCEYRKDVRTPNGISIWISAVSGELVSFTIYDNPIGVSDLSPTITSQLVVSKIKEKYNSLDIIEEISPVLTIEYMDYNKQLLVWEVTVRGEDGTGLWKTRIWNTEYVDARSGEILSPPPIPLIEDIHE